MAEVSLRARSSWLTPARKSRKVPTSSPAVHIREEGETDPQQNARGFRHRNEGELIDPSLCRFAMRCGGVRSEESGGQLAGFIFESRRGHPSPAGHIEQQVPPPRIVEV